MKATFLPPMEGLGLCDTCSLHTTITFSPLPNSSNGIAQYQELDKKAGLNLSVRFCTLLRENKMS
jgi:hypothetical protein